MAKVSFETLGIIEEGVSRFINQNSEYFTNGEDSENRSAAYRALLVRGLKHEGLWDDLIGGRQ